ncbi:unnamed protein product [Penicillium roqueforti FM164]|uniref:Genomic scaffold, ProqFM164S02 n=1 Tax=Penicillium roqueforti (strain FM164) TaxID=1365484 RepID=W6Q835_PENRF|nr:unnamed protein product [Penicillium roqueforti FM164]
MGLQRPVHEADTRAGSGFQSSPRSAPAKLRDRRDACGLAESRPLIRRRRPAILSANPVISAGLPGCDKS